MLIISVLLKSYVNNERTSKRTDGRVIFKTCPLRNVWLQTADLNYITFWFFNWIWCGQNYNFIHTKYHLNNLYYRITNLLLSSLIIRLYLTTCSFGNSLFPNKHPRDVTSHNSIQVHCFIKLYTESHFFL